MKTYFVYTENKIPSVGGVTPQGVEIGIGAYMNLRSGSVENTLDLLSISEFNPIPCSKGAALGLSLIGITEIVDAITEKTKLLTATQKKNKAEAIKLVAKLEKRFSINSEIDDGDAIADLSRKVAILERSLNAVYNFVSTNTVIDTKTKTIFKNYVESDLLANVDVVELSNTIRVRENRIATLRG